MKTNIIVILDPGHGQETPGKRSPDGNLREYKWTRDMCRYVKPYLERKGFIVTYTVNPDDPSDVPLSERARRANMIYDNFPDYYCILVSIHCNAAGNGKDWVKTSGGYSAYTSEGFTEADLITEFVLRKAKEILPTYNHSMVREFNHKLYEHDFEENFTILMKTKMPAVLIEHWFMDQEHDCKFLLKEKSLKAASEVLSEGLIDYAIKRLKFRPNLPPEGYEPPYEPEVTDGYYTW